MNVAATVLVYVSLAYFMFKAVVWLYRTGRNLFLPSIEKKETFTTNKLPMPTDDKYSEESIFSFTYILFTWMSLILILVINGGGANLLQLTPMGLLQSNIAFIIMELCFINFHLRQVQFEAIVNLCRLIEAKRAYVRYISHELRTPLNSAFLGLKMMLDQLRDSENPVDKERYETLSDVYQACMTAVDILVNPLHALHTHDPINITRLLCENPAITTPDKISFDCRWASWYGKPVDIDNMKYLNLLFAQ